MAMGAAPGARGPSDDERRTPWRASAPDDPERRYRLIAENASDVVVEIGIDGAIRWASPSIEAMLGRPVDELVGRIARDLVVPADHDLIEAGRREVLGGGTVEDLRCRVITADGVPRWVSLRGQPVIDDDIDDGTDDDTDDHIDDGTDEDTDDSAVSAIVVGLRDCHDEVIAERALRTLSTGNGLLVRATDEQALLEQMCEIAVSQGGYPRLAARGLAGALARRVHPPRGPRAADEGPRNRSGLG